MKDINRIIHEEIDRFILTENISNLSRFATAIDKELNAINKDRNINNLNSNLQGFLYKFVTYCAQVVQATNRCVQANSLNEGVINLPPELGGNAIRYFKYGYGVLGGYNGARRFFRNIGNNIRDRRSTNNVKNARQNASSQAVKLGALLQQLQKWENQCARCQIGNYVQNVNMALRYLQGLKNEYDYLLRQQQNTQQNTQQNVQQNTQQNAQGQNP
jgi:hypothetical protein